MEPELDAIDAGADVDIEDPRLVPRLVEIPEALPELRLCPLALGELTVPDERLEIDAGLTETLDAENELETDEIPEAADVEPEVGIPLPEELRVFDVEPVLSPPDVLPDADGDTGFELEGPEILDELESRLLLDDGRPEIEADVEAELLLDIETLGTLETDPAEVEERDVDTGLPERLETLDGVETEPLELERDEIELPGERDAEPETEPDAEMVKEVPNEGIEDCDGAPVAEVLEVVAEPLSVPEDDIEVLPLIAVASDADELD